MRGFGIEPTLVLPALADRILLRRPFALGSADAATSEAMGGRISDMLEPGSYVEVRPTVRADPSQAPDVAHFRETGAFPEGADPIARDMIREAAADITGLGSGEFDFIVRIYAPPGPP